MGTSDTSHRSRMCMDVDAGGRPNLGPCGWVTERHGYYYGLVLLFFVFYLCCYFHTSYVIFMILGFVLF
jgi:hypothetical protein